MYKKYFFTALTGILILFLTACSREPKGQAEASSVNATGKIATTITGKQVDDNKQGKVDNTSKIFAEIKGSVAAGIIFDNRGNAFVARDGSLNKVTPDGKITEFCSLKELPKGKDYYFESPLIWDMTFDKDNNILAAAQDRILKINQDGKVSTLLQEDFDGFLGASGIEADKDGNLYITNGDKIIKYTPDLKKSVFIESIKSNLPEVPYSYFSLKFDPDYKNLYVSEFNNKILYKYPIKADGTADSPVVIVKEPIKDSGSFGAPLNITFSKKGNMYVSIDGMSQVMKVDSAGKIDFIKLGDNLSNHIIAFGGNGFDEKSIYFTTYQGDNLYRYTLEE